MVLALLKISQHSEVMTLSSNANIEIRSRCAQAASTTTALHARESCRLSNHRHVSIIMLIRQALSLLKPPPSVPCTTPTVLSVHLQLVLWDMKMTVDINNAMQLQLAVVWRPGVDKHINRIPRCDRLSLIACKLN